MKQLGKLEKIVTFDEIKDELAAVGIEFSYYFDADYDRNICLDNGWKINLSRGLDLFENFGRFSRQCPTNESPMP